MQTSDRFLPKKSIQVIASLKLGPICLQVLDAAPSPSDHASIFDANKAGSSKSAASRRKTWSQCSSDSARGGDRAPSL